MRLLEEYAYNVSWNTASYDFTANEKRKDETKAKRTKKTRCLYGGEEAEEEDEEQRY